MGVDYSSLPPPEISRGTQGSGVGVVKWYKLDKGYGSIACNETAPWDIWCHFSAVEGEGFRSLVPGQRVEVDYQRADQDSFRYRAIRVRVIDTGSNDDDEVGL